MFCFVLFVVVDAVHMPLYLLCTESALLPQAEGAHCARNLFSMFCIMVSWSFHASAVLEGQAKKWGLF